jgi:phospholipid/cholesterol/gamma-HCH transport system substrate-binding protein
MSQAAKVGAFFLVVLILAGLLIWKIEDLELGRVAGRVVSVQFDDVAGLKEKSDVRMAGVLVGKVARIRLVGGKALVDIELTRDVTLREGASASIQSLGMLGDKYVELIPGPVHAAELPAGTTLQGEAPVSFDQITRLARDIEVDIRDITSNLKESLGGALGEERLTGIVDNVLVLSQELRKILESNRANIDATTANFREFSTQMTELVDRIDKLVAANSGNVTDSIANAKELTAKLQTTVDNMNAITGKMNLDLGLRAEYLAAHNKGQGYFTVDLAKVGESRFYRLELSSEPFGVRRDTTTITTTTYPDGHTEVVLNPHAKLSGRFYFSPSVFVIGGWDDLLNTKANRDSLFIGAGVRWGDDDMKYLAGAVY